MRRSDESLQRSMLEVQCSTRLARHPPHSQRIWSAAVDGEMRSSTLEMSRGILLALADSERET